MERHTYIRIARIDDLIRRKKYPNCRRLANEFEVTERTILRDIEAMRDSLGAPLRYSKKQNGYYYEEDKFSLPAVRLTEGELISVFLGTDIIKKYKNTPFANAIQKAFEKVELLLPDSVSIDFKDLQAAYSFDIEQVMELDKQAARAFDLLARAISSRNSVEVNYYTISRDVTEKRVLDPYHLRHALGAWYLIAYCHKRKGIRTFAINQIKQIRVLKDSFEVQKGFDAEKFFADSFRLEKGTEVTKVAVRLDKSIARWFYQRTLHPSQESQKHKDGSLTLSFRVSGTEEIKRWILSQGSKAKVLEPKALKEEIKTEARRMAA